MPETSPHTPNLTGAISSRPSPLRLDRLATQPPCTPCDRRVDPPSLRPCGQRAGPGHLCLPTRTPGSRMPGTPRTARATRHIHSPLNVQAPLPPRTHACPHLPRQCPTRQARQWLHLLKHPPPSARGCVGGNTPPASTSSPLTPSTPVTQDTRDIRDAEWPPALPRRPGRERLGRRVGSSDPGWDHGGPGVGGSKAVQAKAAKSKRPKIGD